MNKRAVQGYIIASGFMNMYKEKSKLKEKENLMYFYLGKIMSKYIERNKISIKKETTIAWNRFNDLTKSVDMDISILPFVCELIFRNPNRDKNKQLTKITREVQKDFLFTKDEIIKDTKQIVRDFYDKNI